MAAPPRPAPNPGLAGTRMFFLQLLCSPFTSNCEVPVPTSQPQPGRPMLSSHLLFPRRPSQPLPVTVLHGDKGQPPG